MASIVIREAREEDLPTLLSFEQGIIEAERPFDDQLASSPISYYDLSAYLNCSKTYIAVAEVDGELAGSGYAQIRDSSNYLLHSAHVYLGFMFVDERYRGKSINKSIINHLKSWSKSQGVTRAILDVYVGNEAAISAYEKVEFKQKLIKMEADWSD